MNPRVSVVIPTYNREEKVQRGIEDVLSQSMTDFEVIVVDDGSSDRTETALKSAFGDRIRYFRQQNQGASVARNRGIQEARGGWIAFLDSDDRWEKDKLDWQLRALNLLGPQCGACYTDVRFFNHSETRTMFQLAEENYRHEREMGVNSDVLRLLVKPGGSGMVVCLSSFMVRADILRASGGFDRKLLYSQDSELMFRLAMKTSFCYVNRPLVLFDRSPVEDRHVGVSSQWNKMDFFLNDSQLRLEGLLRETIDQPPAIRSLIRHQLGSVHSGWVNYYLQSGQYRKARSSAAKAARLDPRFNLVAKWLLAWVSPKLALRTVHSRESTRAEGFTV